MSRPPLEVADLIRSAGAAFIERNCHWLNWKHIKVLLAIARCRTATLGGHLDQCTRCGHRATISYAFSPCCIPGIRSSNSIPMSIALFPLVGCRSITPTGLNHAIGSSFPSTCSVVFSAASLLLL
jgi:hypothetical protein